MNRFLIMINILTILTVIIGIVLTVAILLQHKGAGLGAGFGGTGVTITNTKRGVDLFLHKLTIALSILFFGMAFIILLIS